MYRTDQLNDYQREILTSLLSCKNCLNIFACGIGHEAIIYALFSIYLTDKSLVLVVNGKEEFLNHFLQLSNSDHYHSLTSDVSIKERRAVYLSGGLVSVTSRILVVDFLLDRIPSHLVAGIVVLDADEVAEKSIESFLLHLYREKNKEGFVKSFSTNPQAFALSGSFSQLEKSLNWLKGEEVFLWPRFHASISAVLDQASYEVEEQHILLGKDTMEVQFALMQLLDSTVSELRRTLGATEDESEICPMRALSHQFDSEVKQLIHIKYPAAIEDEFKPFLLLKDIRQLRHFISALFNEDPIGFFSKIELFQLTEFASGNEITRSFLFQNDNWNCFYELAKERSKNKSNLQPKIEALLKIISKHSGEEIVIVVKSESEAKCVFSALKNEPNQSNQDEILSELKKKNPQKSISKDAKGKEMLLKRLKITQSDSQELNNNNSATHTDSLQNEIKTDSIQIAIQSEFVDSEDFSIRPEELHRFEILNSPVIRIKTAREIKEPFLLNIIHPTVIVLLVPSLEIIRRIESSQVESLKSVYFVIYKNSIEEQRFLSHIRSEKIAFERLIQENSLLPQRFHQAAVEGEDELNEYKPKVIVDMRDFRSSLPFALYKLGFAIYPVTLEVGDYVLTKNICVERKSITDLVSSLNTGRLYSQLQAMTSAYKRPMLLIEFDPSKGSFNLQGVTQPLTLTDVQAKLCLLTLHFPTVKIIWSPNLEFTARLFQSLKMTSWQGELEQEPDISVAQQETFDEKFCNFYHDLLLHVDGIHEGNVYQLMEKFDSLSILVLALSNDAPPGISLSDWQRVKDFFRFEF